MNLPGACSRHTPIAAPRSARTSLLLITTTSAALLYLDRICMGEIVKSAAFRAEMPLTPEQTGRLLSAFFFAYAFGQFPAGWLADRFGPRRMLTLYVLLWSMFTALTGFATGLASLVLLRALTGLSEAGAYPACGKLIRAWFDPGQRGRASGCVAFGGRLGNALALYLTAVLILALGGWRHVLWLYGSAGLLVAIAAWKLLRDAPEGTPAPARHARGFPFRALMTHGQLWLFSLAQFGVNFGAALSITWLPAYLQDALKVPGTEASRLLSFALFAGLAGLPLGGFFADWSLRRFGAVWGRRIPLLTGYCLAAAAFAIMLVSRDPRMIAAAAGAVEFFTVLSTAAVWAMNQDIGQEHTGVCQAWTNGLGNMGAAVLPLVVPWMKDTSTGAIAWPAVFGACLGAYLISALIALRLDPRRTLVVR